MAKNTWQKHMQDKIYNLINGLTTLVTIDGRLANIYKYFPPSARNQEMPAIVVNRPKVIDKEEYSNKYKKYTAEMRISFYEAMPADYNKIIDFEENIDRLTNNVMLFLDRQAHLNMPELFVMTGDWDWEIDEDMVEEGGNLVMRDLILTVPILAYEGAEFASDDEVFEGYGYWIGGSSDYQEIMGI